jgi:hypothetical protein
MSGTWINVGPWYFYPEANPEKWPARYRKAFEANGWTRSPEEWATNALAQAMREAGEEFIAAHPALFRERRLR